MLRQSSSLPSMADDQFEYQQARITNFQRKERKGEVPSHFNVVICGDYGVGKTSLIQSFCNRGHEDISPESIHWTRIMDVCGRECALDLIEIWSNAVTGVERWDIMGRFRNMDAIDSLILVYDVGNRKSFLSLRDVHSLLVEIPELEGKIPITIFANKTDIPQTEWEVGLEEGEEFAREINAYFDCLTKTDDEKTRHCMWNAMKDPAEWRVLAEMEAEGDRETRLDEVKARLVKIAPRKGNTIQKALDNIRKRRKRIGTNPTNFYRLPTTSPTVDTTWEEWILKRQ